MIRLTSKSKTCNGLSLSLKLNGLSFNHMYAIDAMIYYLCL